MDELRKREAAARGEDPDPSSGRPPDGSGDGDPDDDDDEAGKRHAGSSDAMSDDASDDDATDDEATDDDAATDDDEGDSDRPQPISDARRRGRRRGRGPGGPDDGAGSRAARAGRRIGIALLILVVLGIVLLFSVGIDLWTDALWYISVGFDAVFWTRLAATVGLGIGAFLVALIVLLGNLWLAGRLSPPPSAEGGIVPFAVRSAERRGAGRRRTAGPDAIAVRRRTRPVRQRPLERAADRVRDDGHARSPAARRLDPRRPGGLPRAHHRRVGVGRLGDRAAVDPSRPVLGDRVGDGSDLPSRHRLLPVRAARSCGSSRASSTAS